MTSLTVGAMSLTRLSLSQFRSYADCVVAPGTGFNVLTGENGAGKTNILEAISLLVPGRGLRGAALADMARTAGPGGFSVSASLGDVDLGTGTQAQAPDRRIVRINGATAAATALSHWLSVIWLTPAMDRLFADGAGDRRRFLDRLVLAVDPEHARHSSRYDAAMRQRNRLLGGVDGPDPGWLSALETQMAEHGTAIAQARQSMVSDLQGTVAAQPDGPFAKAALSITGWSPACDLRAELAAGRARDAAAGRTLAGPHRCDLSVVHLAKDQPAARCSTGEQKALLLGLILCHADLVADRAGRRPILLLDEVAAHLDPRRRQALFDRLSLHQGQVWMTGTEIGLFAQLNGTATHIIVQDGAITTGSFHQETLDPQY
jgi:DNA replication and repair protein RecF